MNFYIYFYLWPVLYLKKKFLIKLTVYICYISPFKKIISGDKTQFNDCLYFICLWQVFYVFIFIFLKWFMYAILLCIRIVPFIKGGKKLLCIRNWWQNLILRQRCSLYFFYGFLFVLFFFWENLFTIAKYAMYLNLAITTILRLSIFIYGQFSTFLFYFVNGLGMLYCYVLELCLLSKGEKFAMY